MPGTSFSDGDSRPAGDCRVGGGECCIPGDQITGKYRLTFNKFLRLFNFSGYIIYNNKRYTKHNVTL